METKFTTSSPSNEVESTLDDTVLPQKSSCATPGMFDETDSKVEPQQATGSVGTVSPL